MGLSIADAVDQIQDADREAGRITNWLYAGEFEPGELPGVVTEIEDLSDEMEALAEKLADGATDGKRAEMAGWLDDATSNLVAAASYLRDKDITETCISLEAAAENLTEACNAANR